MPQTDILMTGAGSFVGGHVLDFLAGRGLTILATVRDGAPRMSPQTPSDGITFARLDLGDPDAYRHLPARVGTVIHIAAASSTSNQMSALVAANIDGTWNLANYARKADAQRLLFASSLSVHGDIASPAVGPETPVVNPDAYGVSKWVGEALLRELADDLPSVAIRLPAVIGPGARRHWLSGIVKKALAGDDIEIFNPTAAFNNAVAVRDLAAFLLHLGNQALSKSVAFPVAASGMTTVEQAVQTVIEATASTSKIHVVPSDRTSFTIDTTMAESLGFHGADITQCIADYARAEKNS